MKFKIKKVLIGLFITGSILTLSACGSKSTSTNTKDDSSSKNEVAPRPTGKATDLSQALKDYKFWYYFNDERVTKDSVPYSVLVSDGNGKIAEYDWDWSKAEEEKLTFSNFLKLDDKEKFSMLTINTKYALHDGVDLPILNKVDNSDIFGDLKINIITDGTGNQAKAEEITIPLFGAEHVPGGSQIVKKSRTTTIINPGAYGAYANIYDYTLKGYYVGYHRNYDDDDDDEFGIDGVLLTETGNENIHFQLDSPKDASKNITVDGNE
ncbi:hypothetical protein [Lactococcus lactis]|uniref:hypothetical protein n=1 Tax=Lactococcus lactis TaxID=1358 RepID=UPI00288C7C3A|nr:hypothetical protein [Lactococcus lactis]MDT2868999.1 hypothetical protein [Lactococcus lactis]